MSVQRSFNNKAYGLQNPLQGLAPQPIIANRAPSSSDAAEFGTQWLYNNLIWVYTSNGTWTELAADSGSATFSSLTVTGNSTLNGLDVVATSNAVDNVTISTDGGTFETMNIVNFQGTSNGAIVLQSVSGGIQIAASLGNIAISGHNASISASFSSTNNARIGTSVLTGNTLAQNADGTVTLVNSFITATGGLIWSISNTNVSGGAALLTVVGSTQAAGSLTITVLNSGGAGGLGATDSIVVSFMVLS